MRVNVVSVAAFTERGKAYGRLDAEFVDPEMLRLERHLKNQHAGDMLSGLSPSEPEIFVRPKDPVAKTVSYVAIDDIDPADGFLFHQEMSEEELPGRAKFKLNAYDIVVSNVRPERGGVGIVLPAQAGAIGSSGLTVLRLASKRDRNVLFAYLRTQAARTQLIRRSRGSMYPAITKEDVADILVPKFGAEIIKQVDGYVNASLAARNDFFDLQTGQSKFVEDYLNSNLGPPPPDIVLDVAGPLSIRITTRTEFFDSAANRFDAEFFRQEYADFLERIKKRHNVKPLGASYVAFAGVNLGRGTQTLWRLRQAQLTAFGVTYPGLELVDAAKAPAKAKISAGDVLIACTAHEPHYVGRRVDLVDQLPVQLAEKVVPVADVMVIRARNEGSNLPPTFLASFLRSSWGRRQFQRLNRGVRGGHVYGQDVEAFIYVPQPDKPWLKEFDVRQERIRAVRRSSIIHMEHAVDTLEASLKI